LQNGNLGIGTTNPAEKLEVSGNIKLSGVSATYKITNVANPTANQDVATKAYVDAAGSGSKTAYLTSATFQGNHNCDDNPATCCATGYHFCSVTELPFGDRRIEDKGTGREPNPASYVGYIDWVASAYCNDWTSNIISSVPHLLKLTIQECLDPIAGCSIIPYDRIRWTSSYASGSSYSCQYYYRLWCCSD